MIIALSERGLSYFKELFMRKSTSISLEEKEAIPLQKYYRARCEVTPQGNIFLSSIKDALPHYIDMLVTARIPHPGTPKRGITKIMAILPGETASETIIEMQILT